jgi:hypothetical protein
MQSTYQKTTEGDKLILFATRFESWYEYDYANGCRGFILMIIPLLGICTSFYSYLLATIAGWQLFCILLLSFIWIFLTIKSTIAAKNNFFELTISPEEISFYSYTQKWTYKVADIEKIRSEFDLESPYSPIFVINGRATKLFLPSFIQQYQTFAIIEELCRHTGIKLEDERGNLVKI